MLSGEIMGTAQSLCSFSLCVKVRESQNDVEKQEQKPTSLQDSPTGGLARTDLGTIAQVPKGSLEKGRSWMSQPMVC